MHLVVSRPSQWSIISIRSLLLMHLTCGKINGRCTQHLLVRSLLLNEPGQICE